jgi:multidrug efflux pump subunit AcrB
LIYLIIGVQIKSYWQPFLILATVLLAFTGVTFSLLTTGNPLSMFTLAASLAGESLIWEPVASAIVWGLEFSTALTLVVIPLLFRAFMGNQEIKR